MKGNGKGGTGHGRRSFMLARGGPVNGGRVRGGSAGLDEAPLFAQRDLPLDTDFRVVFAEALEGVFGIEPPEGIFPGSRVEAHENSRFLAT